MNILNKSSNNIPFTILDIEYDQVINTKDQSTINGTYNNSNTDKSKMTSKEKLCQQQLEHQ